MTKNTVAVDIMVSDLFEELHSIREKVRGLDSLIAGAAPDTPIRKVATLAGEILRLIQDSGLPQTEIESALGIVRNCIPISGIALVREAIAPSDAGMNSPAAG